MDVQDFFNTEQPMSQSRFLVSLAAGFARAVGILPRVANDGASWRRFLETVKLGVHVGPVEVSAALRDDESFGREVEKWIHANRATFRAAFHDLIAELAGLATGEYRGVVFIIDSVDHFRGRAETFAEVRRSVEIVFNEGADDLHLPNVHALYTVPIWIDVAPLGIRRDILNITVRDPEGRPYDPGLTVLREVLERRAPGGDLNRLLGTRELADELITTSGGLFRDLFRLTGQLLLASREPPATAIELRQAASVVRQQTLTTLSREQAETLREVHSTKRLEPPEDRWHEVAGLMAQCLILRYPNGDTWYDTNPLLEAWLDQG